MLEVSRKLIATGESDGCASAEELIDLMYPNRLQDQVNALRVLQNGHDHLTQVTAQAVYKRKAAAVSAIYILEQILCGYKQTLVTLIESIKACNSSDLDVLVSLSNDLEEVGRAFLDTNHALCDACKRFGYARSKEPLESFYHDLLQRLMNAGRMLKDRHD